METNIRYLWAPSHLPSFDNVESFKRRITIAENTTKKEDDKFAALNNYWSNLILRKIKNETNDR